MPYRDHWTLVQALALGTSRAQSGTEEDGFVIFGFATYGQTDRITSAVRLQRRDTSHPAESPGATKRLEFSHWTKVHSCGRRARRGMFP